MLTLYPTAVPIPVQGLEETFRRRPPLRRADQPLFRPFGRCRVPPGAGRKLPSMFASNGPAASSLMPILRLKRRSQSRPECGRLWKPRCRASHSRQAPPPDPKTRHCSLPTACLPYCTDKPVRFPISPSTAASRTCRLEAGYAAPMLQN